MHSLIIISMRKSIRNNGNYKLYMCIWNYIDLISYTYIHSIMRFFCDWMPFSLLAWFWSVAYQSHSGFPHTQHHSHRCSHRHYPDRSRTHRENLHIHPCLTKYMKYMTAKDLWLNARLKYCQCISIEDTTKLQLATETFYHGIIQNINNPSHPTLDKRPSLRRRHYQTHFSWMKNFEFWLKFH